MYFDCSMSFKSLSERDVDQHKFKTKLCVKERSYTVMTTWVSHGEASFSVLAPDMFRLLQVIFNLSFDSHVPTRSSPTESLVFNSVKFSFSMISILVTTSRQQSYFSASSPS